MQTFLAPTPSPVPTLTVLRNKHLLISEIMYLKADRNYTFVHLEDGKVIHLSRPLRHYAELLSSHHFIRCHKSYLVNAAHVKTLDKSYVMLNNDLTFAVARRRRMSDKS
ncbi:MAG: LytR/AlgR family response regulator transcription factor [Runella sp.]